MLRHNSESNVSSEEPSDDTPSTRALAPNAIPVGAAVSVTFAIA
jgi:hypothetical protein